MSHANDAAEVRKAKVLQILNATNNAATQVAKIEKTDSEQAPGQQVATKHEARQKRQQASGNKSVKERTPCAGVLWCLQHKQALLKSGWTHAELFARQRTRRITKPGIAWLSLWEKAVRGPVTVHHEDTGQISFAWAEHDGRVCKQTAWPEATSPAYKHSEELTEEARQQ